MKSPGARSKLLRFPASRFPRPVLERGYSAPFALPSAQAASIAASMTDWSTPCFLSWLAKLSIP